MQTPPEPGSPAELLNRSCDCITLDEAELAQALIDESRHAGLGELGASHPHLFSRTALFVEASTLGAMAEVVAAVERVVSLPAYRASVLADAHPHAQHDPKARGAFLGYDFHLSARGPQLIEINTNAGGGLLNALLRSAQRACCAPVADAFGVCADRGLAPFYEMMVEEWRLARGERPLKRIAIVDDQPEGQYLYPEFLLFAQLARSRGVDAVICDAADAVLHGQTLLARGQAVDLVYNRTTDFALAEARHTALADAYLRDLAVVTPHPRAHALYADKRRLALLSDRDALIEAGAAPTDIELLLRHVPCTRVVDPAQRDALWNERKNLFFKPQSGYGSKAAYRGDKLTKGVFERILHEPYVVQSLVPPSGRTIRTASGTLELRADIRNFAYAGRVQLVCARLYQGQTTNFRTPGGGFAPVYATK